MSLRPELDYAVPEQTARYARAAFPKGTLCLRLYDELGTVFRDEDFADLFPRRGQPGLSPFRLALVTVLQYVEGLTDRAAADAVRSRIDWKYLLCLDLGDPGFDASVLVDFRARLLGGGAERRLLERVLALLAEHKLVKARGKQRTDSTHVLSAVRELNRLERVLETMRVALNALAEAEPEWLRAIAPGAWVERYGYRPDAWRLPEKAAEREALLAQVGEDGYALLEAVWAAGPEAARALEQVETLRVVWVQNFHVVEGEGRPRGPKDLPPASRHVDTPHDVEARHGAKNATRWTGYKVHVTESCEPGLPHVVTDVATRPSLEGDNDALPAIHERLERVGLLPSQHLVDGGYVEGKGLVESRERYGVDLYGPAPGNRGWQAEEGTGYAISEFRLEWEQGRAVCPQGAASSSWKPGRDSRGDEVIHIQFAGADCGPCPARERCTRSKAGRRTLNVRPRDRHEAIEAARARGREEGFTATYKKRAGIEGTISAGVRAFQLRRSRYVGAAKLGLQHLATAAAINLVRVWAWLEGDRPKGTKRSAFLRLMVPIAA